MSYSKLFFPIGGGEELEERIHGALLIDKYFNAHLEVLSTKGKPFFKIEIDDQPSESLAQEAVTTQVKKEEKKVNLTQKCFEQECKKLDISISKNIIQNKPTAQLLVYSGLRSKLVQEESKFCDLVVLASPPSGRITSTFENTITKSGKPAIIFPRYMKNFKAENILIGWNDSAQCSKAISLAIPLMQKAKYVRIVTSAEFVSKVSQIKKLQDYLKMHDIETDYDIIATTKIPGQALLDFAKNNYFDMIIAGAFGRKGFREIMFGGTTRYILENTEIPIFMAH